MEKSGVISYVLVANESDNSNPWYYAGYFKNKIPCNTQEYIESMKIPFSDEAEMICRELNKNQKNFQYHVEEHGYSYENLKKIKVNGRDHLVSEEKANVSLIVKLAFGEKSKWEDIVWTIVYCDGPPENREGSLYNEKTVRLISGMIFNCTLTNNA